MFTGSEEVVKREAFAGETAQHHGHAPCPACLVSPRSPSHSLTSCLRGGTSLLVGVFGGSAHDQGSGMTCAGWANVPAGNLQEYYTVDLVRSSLNATTQGGASGLRGGGKNDLDPVAMYNVVRCVVLYARARSIGGRPIL